MKVKVNVMFTIAAVYGFLVGLPALLAPATIANMSGLPASSGALMALRFVGVEALGLGIIAFLIRNSEPKIEGDAVTWVTLGFTIYFAVHALTSLYGQFTDTSTSMHWIMATIQGLIAVGFFMAGWGMRGVLAKR